VVCGGRGGVGGGGGGGKGGGGGEPASKQNLEINYLQNKHHDGAILLGCYSVWTGKQSMTFRKNEMPPCLGSGRHSETPVTTYQSARRHNPQHLDLQQHRSKNLKPRTVCNCKVRICNETKCFSDRSDVECLLCVKQHVVTGFRATVFN